ncbi:MAG: hypothetical protein K6T83_02780 [Alicyclobacillus sp.]|nr:hypothetical protein [Alicyclobacillus sp.]
MNSPATATGNSSASDEHLSAPVTMTDMVHLRPTCRADNAWFGDPVPMYWNGWFHLFYVWDQGHLVMPRVMHRWGHFASQDLVHWFEYPFAISPDAEASDGTGSVFYANGRFHMYYLGRYFRTNGEMYETLCHATSDDLIHWTKDPANPISLPDLRYYRSVDWRDGFPFWNEARQQYWMLVTATLNHPPASRRGCLALLISDDLVTWTSQGPYWAPALGCELECPDLFEWNGWWYLLVSGTFGRTTGTIYRKSRSPEGPWETPEVDTFDGPLLYACKTAGNQERRVLFGWVGTREGSHDAGRIQWGGHGLVRELVQDDHGDLWVRCPDARRHMGTAHPAPQLTPKLGVWHRSTMHPWEEVAVAATAQETFVPVDSEPNHMETWIAEGQPGLSYAVADAPPEFLLSMRVRPAAGTRRFGVFLRTDPDLNLGYQVEIDLVDRVLAITGFGMSHQVRPQPLVRPIPAAAFNRTGNTANRRPAPHERANTRPDTAVYDILVVASGTIVEVFVNDCIALAGRYYQRTHHCIGLFTEAGGARFEDIHVRRLPDEPW